MTGVTFICRDCLEDTQSETRCTHCRSPRLITHPERATLSIAHVDCDAFFAAVEKRDNPALRDKPVIIGGGQRGVVATACYIARTRGVRSAMPMFKALKACPEAVVIHPDLKKYSAVGREVRQMMLELTPLVEAVSIDEAFLDLKGTDRLHGRPPAAMLARLARDVERRLGITLSIGLSHNKFLAKIASDLDKPRGFSIIGREETLSFLSNRPIGLIWGVGKVMQDKLRAESILTFKDVWAQSEDSLIRRWGKEGQRLYRLSRGQDTRPVLPARDTKSISSETTFDKDTDDAPALRSVLWQLCERVAERLRREQVGVSSLTLKLKTHDFQSVTRSRSGFSPTRLASQLFEVAESLLLNELLRKKHYRLIGVGVSHFHPLSETDVRSLLSEDLDKQVAKEEAVARIRSKFGASAVYSGLTYDSRKLTKTGPRER